MKQDDEVREAVAKELIRQALEGFQNTVPASVLEDIQTLLELDLLCTEEGGQLLRTVMADPVVQQSGEVAREPIERKKAANDP